MLRTQMITISSFVILIISLNHSFVQHVLNKQEKISNM
jgi:hypothetical protein